MKEFFNLEYGKTLEGKVTKVKGSQTYKVTKKIEGLNLKKGDYFYLDKLHGDHIEVFNEHGIIRSVINLDGSLNVSKTTIAAMQKRTINI